MQEMQSIIMRSPREVHCTDKSCTLYCSFDVLVQKYLGYLMLDYASYISKQPTQYVIIEPDLKLYELFISLRKYHARVLFQFKCSEYRYENH